ncbi:MAG: ABC transporter permease [Bacilli bacterium]|jgi:sodium transport system permease protein
MKNIITIIKKELTRFFRDSRLVLTTLLLPGLMIFGIYSIMGEGMTSFLGGDPDYIPLANVVNLPDSVSGLIEQSEVKITMTSILSSEIDASKTAIEDGDLDLLMVFEENFDQKVTAARTLGDPAPTAELFFNSTKVSSYNIYGIVSALIDAYETSVSNVITLNGDVDTAYDMATDEAALGQILSMILPFLILSFLFSGCLAVTPESIAGEKERGTIATLLVTPIKRRELAIGKIISLSILATLAALSSFVGTILSFPKIIGMQGGDATSALANFLVTDYLGIVFVIVSIVLLIVSFLAILSAYSRSVKEASALAMPFMIIVMMTGILTMFNSGAASNWFVYLIPIYGPTQALVGIFSFATDWLHIAIAGLSSVLYASVCGLLLIRMFNSEAVMFKR